MLIDIGIVQSIGLLQVTHEFGDGGLLLRGGFFPLAGFGVVIRDHFDANAVAVGGVTVRIRFFRFVVVDFLRRESHRIQCFGFLRRACVFHLATRPNFADVVGELIETGGLVNGAVFIDQKVRAHAGLEGIERALRFGRVGAVQHHGIDVFECALFQRGDGLFGDSVHGQIAVFVHRHGRGGLLLFAANLRACEIHRRGIAVGFVGGDGLQWIARLQNHRIHAGDGRVGRHLRIQRMAIRACCASSR